jgi:RimJ/RimL family protein N-acetyltransferase
MKASERGDGAVRFVPIERDGTVEIEGGLPVALRDACAATARLYEWNGFVPPWTGYVAVADGRPVGTCAFKSAPCDGRVEIAYFTLPEHEGRGIATAMARELIAIAHAARPGVLVTAQTLPVENASTAILRRLAFARAGWAHDADAGDVWEWELR